MKNNHVDTNLFQIALVTAIFFKYLVITTDTVARPLVRNSTQFNGVFGCDFCLHPGERVAKKRDLFEFIHNLNSIQLLNLEQ